MWVSGLFLKVPGDGKPKNSVLMFRDFIYYVVLKFSVKKFPGNGFNPAFSYSVVFLVQHSVPD